jgi:hypothetical protein
VAETKSKREPRSSRPKRLDDLLVHYISEVENNAGLTVSGCYKDWLLDHGANVVRFYLGGFNAFRSMTKVTDAKYYHSYVSKARKIAKDQGWTDYVKGAFAKDASYNQFLSAIREQRPIFLDNAVQVIVACECALADAIHAGQYQGSQYDAYDMLKIVPAVYNINDMNADNPKIIQQKVPNYELTVLKHSGQRSRGLLKALTDGSCITRRTARLLRAKTIELLEGSDLSIGDVRGFPGRKKLGRTGATTAEDVELADLSVHLD